MGKVKLFIASSLDNFIAREDGAVDWLFTGDYGYRDFLFSIETVLIGRKTYEQALTFGETYDGKQVYVFTKQKDLRRLNHVEFVSDVVPFVKEIVKVEGDLWLVGGGEIVTVFLNNDLIDEIMLFVHPLLLGKGVPLFKGVEKEIKLEVVETFAFTSGLTKLHFKVLK